MEEKFYKEPNILSHQSLKFETLISGTCHDDNPGEDDCNEHEHDL